MILEATYAAGGIGRFAFWMGVARGLHDRVLLLAPYFYDLPWQGRALPKK